MNFDNSVNNDKHINNHQIMRHKGKTITILVFFCLLLGFIISDSQKATAQYYPDSYYQAAKFDTTKENSLLFRVENSNFLVNYEYFNDILQGYTLIGYFLNPKLVYYPSKNTKIEVGVHLLKYSGIDDYTKATPTLTFHYKASKSTDIIIGTLYGSTNHEMIEPIFSHEFFYTDNAENGLQFLFDTRIYKGDIWINWQQFIFEGDEKQEIFTLGLSNKFYLNGQNKKHSFSIPVQAIFVHQGGQINESPKSVLTLNNSAIGLNYTYTNNSQFFKSIAFESFFVDYNDLSTDNVFPYIEGYGIHSTATVKASYFNYQLGHWYGDSFINAMGNPIYGSVSTIYEGHTERQRALISNRFLFEKNILKGIHVGAGFEVYSDLYNFTADYWYLFYINFNRDFFIKKFK